MSEVRSPSTSDREQRRRFSAVMFTDIAGSTAFYRVSGDEAGRRLIRRHDELLYPIVEAHTGAVLTHTGDGLLAVFDRPDDCCRAAIQMQRAIVADNRARADDELRVRIAAHAGVVLHEHDRVFGMVVNATARVEALAEPGQIVLSAALYEHLGDDLRARCTFLLERELRGTDEVHRLYELWWRDDAPAHASGAGPVDTGALGPGLPTGVTVLCTDVERSHALALRYPDEYETIIARYHELVATTVAECGGAVVYHGGDVTHAWFVDAGRAAEAAATVQRRHATVDWTDAASDLETVSVRASLHTGDLEESLDVVAERAARLSSAAHGGQVLLTAAAARAIAASGAASAIRAHGVRTLQDQRYSEEIFELLVPDLPPSDPVLRTRASPPPVEVSSSRHDGPRAPEAIVADIRAGEPVVLTDGEARAFAGARPADLTAYLLGRVAEWSQPRHQLDTRFVQLTLLVDRGEDSDERWTSRDDPIEDARDLFRSVDEPALVLLGPPGAGKSTLLRRLELDLALDALRADDTDAPIPLAVALNRFRRDPVSGRFPEPGEWLAGGWASRAPDLPPLATLLTAGRVVLLLDGLNEIPTAGERERRDCIRAWKHFLVEAAETGPGNRFVFSCRSLDYSAPLSSPAFPVPQVRVEPLSDLQVRQYLKLFAPAHWTEVWSDVAGSRHLDLLRSPFFLKLLVEQVRASGRLAPGRAALLTGFVREALRRELERDNSALDPPELLTSRDRRQVIAWRWTSAYDVPARGELIPSLERLAFGMQQTRDSTASGEVRIDVDLALDLIGHERAEEVLDAAVALSLVEESTADDQVQFVHQLVQEYFAARVLARTDDLSMLGAPWRHDGTGKDLAEILDGLAPADPLPPLQGTGWEETAILASAMASEPEQFVDAVADVALVLAGRCAALPEVAAHLSTAGTERIADALFVRTRDPDADLRDRVAAGSALGFVGGPRYERRAGPGATYLAPPMVAIPGGSYAIGTDEPYAYRHEMYHEETPACTVELAPFEIGRFSVTNAEWSCFIEGGGYVTEDYWEGDAARSWFHGDGTAVNVRNMARFWRARFIAEPELVEVEYAGDRMDRVTYELWHRRVRMDDEAFEEHLEHHYPAGRRHEPRFWRNAGFNNPMQPVIGISIFEARAFAAWLAAQSGTAFRLPTEVEWEAAARGRSNRLYAYGDTFDPLRGNTVETHLRGPVAVGCFPEGDTPEGVADMTGNTYDLTASLWGDDPLRPSFAYPYDAHDGRERPDAPVTVSRVGRGGAWYLGHVHARVTYRGRDRWDLRPDDWLNYRGMRLARTPSPESG